MLKFPCLYPGESNPIPTLPSLKHTQRSWKARSLSNLFWYVLLHKCLNKNNNNNTHTQTLENVYLQFHSLFQGIPVYSDSDRSSIHIQEYSRHCSCRDRFHKETKNKVSIDYSIKIPPRWKQEYCGPNFAIPMALKLFKGGGSLIGDWDYFSEDVYVTELVYFWS